MPDESRGLEERKIPRDEVMQDTIYHTPKVTPSFTAPRKKPVQLRLPDPQVSEAPPEFAIHDRRFGTGNPVVSHDAEGEVAMRSEAFDLNEQRNENQDAYYCKILPEECTFMVGGTLNYVLLQKDSKNICRTKVCDLPIEV
ncbi:hypothetical protein PR202_gb27924 [Eleusine coracana subsp. coracana]|uniref:Uncharacterized protein n=1 Tax=Eleusine coracana subsp. coracana TaxID=191504 RepID=A0AAV5FV31_ELECO|nr:hypothetical protein PR202_gb27924 [Eleusine coracana subsp. coracana]